MLPRNKERPEFESIIWPEPFCLEFVCSPCVWVLWLLPTAQSVGLGLWIDRGEMYLNSNHDKSSFVFVCFCCFFFVVCYFNSVSVISCDEVVGLSA